MAIPLVISKRHVVHLPSCIRLTRGAHAAITKPWDGTGTAYACRTCLFPKQGRRRPPLPCVKCGHQIAKPCRHNGVMRATMRGGQRPGIYRNWAYPDLALERDWLQSLLDS